MSAGRQDERPAVARSHGPLAIASDGASQRVRRVRAGTVEGRATLGTIVLATLGGLVLGIWTGVGCATSDQVLEKKRRLEELQSAECTTGVTEPCFGGPKEMLGRGACQAGKRACVDAKWGPCEGESVPSEDLCNGKDDDCDGIVDNGFERDGALCFFEDKQGACRTQGRWHCSPDGKQSVCDAPVVEPSVETCDGIDNDCDGTVDEDAVAEAQQACTTGKQGVCNEGENRCVNGQVRCVQTVQTQPESCNGKDDNCNGVVDEGCRTDTPKVRGR